MLACSRPPAPSPPNRPLPPSLPWPALTVYLASSPRIRLDARSLGLPIWSFASIRTLPIHYMGSPAMTFLADDPINHPISTHSTRIPVVWLFIRRGCRQCRIRRPLRGSTHRRRRAEYPRRPRTPSAGNRHLLRQRGRDWPSHWLRDRIDQGRFRILFVPGKKNLADFFTKALPVARHKAIAPFFVVDDDSTDSIDLRLSTILFAAALFAPRTKRVCW